jgi:hypothetical protein
MLTFPTLVKVVAVLAACQSVGIGRTKCELRIVSVYGPPLADMHATLVQNSQRILIHTDRFGRVPSRDLRGKWAIQASGFASSEIEIKPGCTGTGLVALRVGRLHDVPPGPLSVHIDGLGETSGHMARLIHLITGEASNAPIDSKGVSRFDGDFEGVFLVAVLGPGGLRVSSPLLLNSSTKEVSVSLLKETTGHR